MELRTYNLTPTSISCKTWVLISQGKKLICFYRIAVYIAIVV